MNRLNLLVVEDDPVIGKSLRQGLSEAGHDCQWVKTGDDGQAAAATQQYDAVVLDILLPGKSGLDVLREIRSRGNRTPTILLTALGSVEERVAGLNAGADDYLVKPFALPELLARIEAICRRASTRPAPVLQAGTLSLDLTNRRVTAGTNEVDLSPTEFSLLEMLMRHAGQVVTRKMLCEHLWKSDWEGATNVIEVHVNRLRNKLEKVTPQPMIDTVRGRGYAVRAN
ncbi:MAG: response regulator transcription factor [Planctomycetales bacterium]|jgi:two-component system OmpR family response regulator/two-component system copper resistance phosphate regulon response regulator CusR|nr:response regulator transcription factor [Planctomycetales bacterium]MBN8627158.1 response regulator transcription factor [Planctomycetota bacterium]